MSLLQFISIYFFGFMIFLMAGYVVVPAKFRRGFLLVCNILFYLSWAKSILDVLPIVAVTLITWFAALALEKTESISRRRIFLIVAIILSIGSLLYFKYSEFLLDTFNSVCFKLFGSSVLGSARSSIAVPLGISFFTFQSLSYVFEIYKRNIKSEHDLITYAAYVTLFPRCPTS